MPSSPSSSPPRPVAVLGAGIAGLAAAWTLARAGVEVRVLEASDRVGGVIRSELRDGFLAEEGPHSLARPSARVRTLFRDAGLEEHIVTADPERSARYIVRDGRPLPLPTSPAGLLLTPLLSVGGRLRIVAEPFRRRTAPPQGDESVADVLRRRGMGDEVVERFLNPFVAGVYAGNPERLSAPHAFPLLRELELGHGSLVRGLLARLKAARKKARTGARAGGPEPEAGGGHGAILSFRQGMEELPRRLADGLPEGSVRPDAEVRGLRQTDDGWMVGTDGGEAGPFGAVIAAIPAPALARLEGTGAGQAARGALEGVRYPPIALLTLGFRREDVVHPLDGFGMLVPQVEERQVLGALFPSTLFPGRAPEGHVTISSFVGGTRQPELALEAGPAMEARVLEELGALLGVRGEPVFRHRRVWERSIPQIEVGYGAVREATREVEAALPGLVLAGNWVGGVSVGDALASGLEAADRVLAGMG
ncbi:MAG: protoporphyrinogen oxidase [Gemmatimonadales bacterium]|nr:MAG: protoporphyrinogen oxidase [Gemmatimonadales bacterium]